MHMCFGNYRGRAVGWRSYRPLFPHLAKATVQQLALEFASREMAEIELARADPGADGAGRRPGGREEHLGRAAGAGRRAAAAGAAVHRAGARPRHAGLRLLADGAVHRRSASWRAWSKACGWCASELKASRPSMIDEPYLAIQVVMMPRDTNPLGIDLRRRHPQLHRPGRRHRGAARGASGRRRAAVPGDGGHQPRRVQAAGAGRRRGPLPDARWSRIGRTSITMHVTRRGRARRREPSAGDRGGGRLRRHRSDDADRRPDAAAAAAYGRGACWQASRAVKRLLRMPSRTCHSRGTRPCPSPTLHLFFDDVEVGQEWESLGRTVTETDIVNFAGLSAATSTRSTSTTSSPRRRRSAGRSRTACSCLSIGSGLGVHAPADADAGVPRASANGSFKEPVFIGDTIRVQDARCWRRTSAAAAGAASSPGSGRSSIRTARSCRKASR